MSQQVRKKLKVALQKNAQLKADNEQLQHKLGRLLGEQQEWVLVEPGEYARLNAKSKILDRVAALDPLLFEAIYSMVLSIQKPDER